MSETNILASTNKLDSELLRTFLAIADSGSFTNAANRIFRSQSAVSLQIKRLENLLGQAVFERRARGAVLTQTGLKLRPVAQQVVDILDQAIGVLKLDALQGSIRVGIPDEYGETILSDVIAAFTRDHPQVAITVQCGFSAGFPQALAENELDIAVYLAESSSSASILLRNEQTHWVRSRHHRPQEQTPLPVALFDRACWWRDRAVESLEAAGKQYRVAYTSESVTGVIAAIQAGIAVGLVGESFINDELEILSTDYGLPFLPPSSLVIDRREGFDTAIADAMSAAIMTAFR